jgi:hypothetical protein
MRVLGTTLPLVGNAWRIIRQGAEHIDKMHAISPPEA